MCILETLRNVENIYISQVFRITGVFNIALASLYFFVLFIYFFIY